MYLGSGLYLWFLYLLFGFSLTAFIYLTIGFLKLGHKEYHSQVILWSLAIFAFAFCVRYYLFPHIHQVFYDEFYYLNVAQNLHFNNVLAVTKWGTLFNPEVTGPVMRGGGYPIILGSVYKLFGYSRYAAFNINILLASFSVLVMFWIGLLIFGDVHTGILISMIFNLLPVHLRYSANASADMSSLFLAVLSLLAFMLFLRDRRMAQMLSCGLLLAFSAYVKPENMVLIPLLVISLIILWRQKYLKIGKVVLIFVIFLILLFPLISKIPYLVGIEQVNAGGSFASLYHLGYNLPFNIFYLFDFRFFLSIATGFFIWGSLKLFYQNRQKFNCLVYVFLFLFFIFSSYFFGNFHLWFSPDSDRHFLLCSVPFAIISGWGISNIARRNKYKYRLLFLFVVGVILVCNSYAATINLMSFTRTRNVYKEYKFIRKTAGKLPDRYILCISPDYFMSAIEHKAIGLDLYLSRGDYLDEVLLFKGFWWYKLKERSVRYEEQLIKIYSFESLAETDVQSEQYGFYLLKKNKSRP